jgi:PH domain
MAAAEIGDDDLFIRKTGYLVKRKFVFVVHLFGLGWAGLGWASWVSCARIVGCASCQSLSLCLCLMSRLWFWCKGRSFVYCMTATCRQSLLLTLSLSFSLSVSVSPLLSPLSLLAHSPLSALRSPLSLLAHSHSPSPLSLLAHSPLSALRSPFSLTLPSPVSRLPSPVSRLPSPVSRLPPPPPVSPLPLSPLLSPPSEGEVFKTWKKRYFVLEQRLLSYYQSPGDAQVKGVAALDNCVVRVADSKTGKTHTFEIYHPSRRVFYIQAESDQERDDWMVALRKNIGANAAETEAKKRAALEKQLSLLSQQLSAAVEHSEQQRVELELLELDKQTLSQLRTQLAQLTQNSEQTQSQLASVIQERDTQASQIKALEHEKTELCTQIADLSAKLLDVQVQAKAGQELQEQQAELKDMQNKLTTATQEVSRLKLEKKVLARECRRLRAIVPDDGAAARSRGATVDRAFAGTASSLSAGATGSGLDTVASPRQRLGPRPPPGAPPPQNVRASSANIN